MPGASGNHGGPQRLDAIVSALEALPERQWARWVKPPALSLRPISAMLPWQLSFAALPPGSSFDKTADNLILAAG
ncbi:uncharacterized protein TrAFT101_008881 [Trichoderma asperellum]|uniref:uncharacterized protein n=1 Tax=Trichoderma asperellum TaxID=101201 RepID=UPI00331FF65F|nr:hypothetical protein TrAFT101_008881 [Trichoderma asperellum]